jgi:hypothetical protein
MAIFFERNCKVIGSKKVEKKILRNLYVYERLILFEFSRSENDERKINFR